MDQINQSIINRAAIRLTIQIQDHHRNLNLPDDLPAFLVQRIVQATLELTVSLTQQDGNAQLTLDMLKALSQA